MSKKIMLIVGVSIILGYEFWALKNNRPSDTISEIFWKLSKRPIVPFGFGMLAGHFVWQTQSVYETKKVETETKVIPSQAGN